jgi:hypothetical protein
MTPSWDPDDSVKALTRSLSQYDFARASELVSLFVVHLRHRTERYAEGDARELRRALQKHRQFRLLRIATDALIQSDNGSYLTRVAHAQALIETGSLTAAGAVLKALLQETLEAKEGDGPQRLSAGTAYFEACGLVGRMHKQRYVEANAPGVAVNDDALRLALEAYRAIYEKNPSNSECWWHGVNVVALATRAKIDGVALEHPIDIEKIAAELIEAVSAAHADGKASMWDYAVALEACLATDAPGKAFRWCDLYLAHPSVHAFELGSTLRQLKTIWRVPERAELVAELVTRIDDKLLTLPGSSIELNASEAGAELRRLAGAERAGFVHGETYRTGLLRAQSIARITPRSAKELRTGGTGVLVNARELRPELPDECVLLTCSHVVSDASATWQYAMCFSQAKVEFLFGATEGAEPFTTEIEAVLWQADAKLDACLLRLKALPEGVRPCPVRKLTSVDLETIDRVFIAGYPLGEALEGRLQFSLYDNLVIDRSPSALQYRAATLPGSSGSPVFDIKWEMLALHQRGHEMLPRLSGNGEHEANEGKLLSAIAQALPSRFNAP